MDSSEDGELNRQGLVSEMEAVSLTDAESCSSSSGQERAAESASLPQDNGAAHTPEEN